MVQEGDLMVYEWGKLPSKGYPEEIPDSEEIHKGELILFEHSQAGEPVAELRIANKIKEKLQAEGHRVTYIRIEDKGIISPYLPVHEYNLKYMVYVQHESPLTGLEITAIVLAVCVLLGLTLLVFAPVLWKWSGLSPEEVSQYLGGAFGFAGLGGVAIIALGLIVVGLFIFFVWRKK